MLNRLAPFLAWPPVSRATLRADAVAGITVAMVLIPQSMAYAQLAGMPAYYGLYAAFLPVMVGALWGSSNQLATGPVAMVSLLTGSTLAQFAAPGSGQFIALAITLALMAGVLQLAMGFFRLGAIVNFLSHPVIVGFTNAAAIIIALSQLNKLLGVPMARTEHFIADVWGVIQQAGETHWPTLAMGLSAFALMMIVRRFLPKWPGVLIAVMLTTAVSWAIRFENNATAQHDQFSDPVARSVVDSVVALSARLEQIGEEIAQRSAEMQQVESANGPSHPRVLALNYDIEILRIDARAIDREHRLRMRELRRFTFLRVEKDGQATYRIESLNPAAAPDDGHRWRVQRVNGDGVRLSGGGEVVGNIPSGLPTPRLPNLDWRTLSLLLSSAFVITLVGFMEAISIAKAMATRTRQRIDPDQELIGQGLANIAGSICQSFPVSGSFSRSAVNLAAGAVTGLSSVITGAIVLVTLLLFTPLLYHLPQSVLAAVIMMAVVNLVNLPAVAHAWKANRHDGIAAIVTFVATLALAPHLDAGILVGGGLAIVLYLYRTMRPRVALLSRHPDGTLRDAGLHGLAISEHIIVLRFDGSLYFANVPYFEDAVLDAASRHPKARHIIVIGEGINSIDASGEEVIRHMVQRLRANGVSVLFAGLKSQVLNVMQCTGLAEVIGTDNLHRTEDHALAAVYARISDPDFDAAACPLRPTAAARSAEGVYPPTR